MARVATKQETATGMFQFPVVSHCRNHLNKLSSSSLWSQNPDLPLEFPSYLSLFQRCKYFRIWRPYLIAISDYRSLTQSPGHTFTFPIELNYLPFTFSSLTWSKTPHTIEISKVTVYNNFRDKIFPVYANIIIIIIGINYCISLLSKFLRACHCRKSLICRWNFDAETDRMYFLFWRPYFYFQLISLLTCILFLLFLLGLPSSKILMLRCFLIHDLLFLPISTMESRVN